MNIRKIPLPRFFTGAKVFPNGLVLYPVYDRMRLDGRESMLIAYCKEPGDAEAVAAALNMVKR